MAGPGDPATAAIESVRWSVGREGRRLALPVEEVVATEEPLEIRLVHAGRVRPVSVTMRTPTADEDLAVGFLFTEGILTDISEVERIVSHRGEGDQVVDVVTRREVAVDPALVRPFLTNSSCGVCGRSLVQGLLAQRGGPIAGTLRLPASTLAVLPTRLRAAQHLFDRTGGLHAAGLFDVEGSLSTVAEDVGRHNAVDKVIGQRFRAGRLPARDEVLQVSGRVSFEIVQKAGVAGIPVVSAVSAPSSLAVSAADRLGITLAAFVREDRFTLYAHPERVVDAGGPSRSSPTERD